MTESHEKRERIAPDFGPGVRPAAGIPEAARTMPAQSAGQVRGIIRVGGGQPLGGAMVTGARTFPPVGGPLQQPASTISRGDGSIVYDEKSRTAVQAHEGDSTNLKHSRQQGSKSVGLLIGVGAPQGMFHHASVVLDDEMGRTYRVVVPFDNPVSLLVKGNELKLDDDKGKPLAANAPAQTIQVNRSDAAKVFRFNVKGVDK